MSYIMTLNKYGVNIYDMKLTHEPPAHCDHEIASRCPKYLPLYFPAPSEPFGGLAGSAPGLTEALENRYNH